MSSKEVKGDREKSFPERLKRFLKSDKKSVKGFPEIKITEETKFNLGPNSSYEIRLKTIQELEEEIRTKKLQDTSTEKIWVQVRDLLNVSSPPEIRHALLLLLSEIAATAEPLGPRRKVFMRHIMENYDIEDTVPLFNFFECVIRNGRCIEYVEEDVGPFLIKWLPSVLSSFSSKVLVIDLITKLLKYNAAHFDDHIIYQFVMIVIKEMYQSKGKEELYACLGFMDTIIAYVFIPSGTLRKFVTSLARLMSIPCIVQEAWKVMRNLFRTELGDSALISLCELIETCDNFHVVRGAIFFITSALWSKQKISSLTVGAMAILPTLYRASESLHPLVIYETSISISKLVRNHCDELHLPSWDLTLDIIERLFHYTANYSNKEQAQMIFNTINEAVDEIETRINEGKFLGTTAKFYDIVECYSTKREIHSVRLILDNKIEALHPKLSHWLVSLTSMVRRHFREDPRPCVRRYALVKLKYIYDKFIGTEFCEHIVEAVVMSQMDEVQKDPEMVVRKEAVSLLTHMVLTLHGHLVEKVLNLIEKVVLIHYMTIDFEPRRCFKNAEADDVLEGVKGLILIFKKKIWCLPSSHAVTAYNILMAVLNCHYRNQEVLGKVPRIRKEIFDMIFLMRADADYHLGLPGCPDALLPVSSDDPHDLQNLLPKYTPYIVVDHKHGLRQKFSYRQKEPKECAGKTTGELQIEGKNSSESEMRDNETSENMKNEQKEDDDSPSDDTRKVEDDNNDDINEKKKRRDERKDVVAEEMPTMVTHLSLTEAAQIVIVAMKHEKDWSLLKVILERVPQVLQNKALILSKEGKDIKYLAGSLCALVSDDKLNIPDSLHNTPSKFCRVDFNAYIFSVMASLSSYHLYLDGLNQRNIIQCLMNGMNSKSAPLCVSAITLCLLEMRNVIPKLLRDVMMQLSRISATVQNAQPTLEFLSTLVHLPPVYADFLPKQYLSVFAIAIPYTNLFKFNHYIVSLAYHVICMWFMKCRIEHRRCFINFISKNLNMILVNKETSSKMKSSITDQAEKGESDMIQFHKDLRETCVDFMARNCFDSFAPESIRSPVSQTLFNKGQQQSWLIGTRIITITTSGCSKKPTRQGLCERCVQLCLPEDQTSIEIPPPRQESSVSRRRHKSEFQRSVSHEAKQQPQTKDDLHMRSTLRDMQFSEQGDKGQNIDPDLFSTEQEKKNHICCCWCTRWAEIIIRQPTGTVSYATRILNPQTHVTKEDLVPASDLSSFYSPLSQGSLTSFYRKDFLPFHEINYDSCDNHQSLGNLHLPPLSGDAECSLGSETVSAVGAGEEWSNSGSGPSSGAASLGSSETKLNSKVETDAFLGDENHIPVYHCHSNPEVRKGLLEASLCDERPKTHTPLSHTMSLVDTPRKPKNGEDISSSEALLQPSIGNSARVNSKVVKRCNSSAGSPSSPPLVEQTNRMRHSSAFQTGCPEPSTYDNDEEDASLQPLRRDRIHTISDVYPASRNRSMRGIQRRGTLAATSGLSITSCVTTGSSFSLPTDSASASASYSTSLTSSSKSSKECRAGVSPSSVFLQLYYQGCFGGGCFRPILLPTQNQEIERAIKVMDMIKPHEHHRIGVVYVGPKQTTEVEIFRNTCGSERYHQFVDGLGSVYEIKHFSENTNLGGLDKRGVADGPLIHMWQDDLMQVVFHVGTTMPNKDNDPNGNDKKKHIGNDYATIVYNNSGLPYNFNTIKSQLSHFVVEIVPGDHQTNCIRLLIKPALAEFVSWNNSDIPRLVSDTSLPLLGRQLAIHANLASTVWVSLNRTPYQPYATSWLEWLRKVRKLRELVVGKVEAEKHFREMQHLQFPLQEPNELQNQSFLDFSDMIESERSPADIKDRSRTEGFLNRRI